MDMRKLQDKWSEMEDEMKWNGKWSKQRKEMVQGECNRILEKFEWNMKKKEKRKRVKSWRPSESSKGGRWKVRCYWINSHKTGDRKRWDSLIASAPSRPRITLNGYENEALKISRRALTVLGAR